MSFSRSTFPIGVRQEIHPNDIGNEKAIEKTTKIIMDTFTYVNKIMTQPKYSSVRAICQNNDEYCAALAADGACQMPKDYQSIKDDDNTQSIDVDLYEFMISECAPACQTCNQFVPEEELNIVKDCVADSDSNIFGPGDINRMFERMVGESDEGDVIAPKSKIKIHSRPDYPAGIKTSDAPLDYFVGGPWVVTIDDFLTDEECLSLISMGHALGYARSSLEEEKDYNEEELARLMQGSEDAYRTSTNTWCEDNCHKDPTTQRIIEKLSNATGIPDSHAEYLQLLRYEEGQYYKDHHDVGGDEYVSPSLFFCLLIGEISLVLFQLTKWIIFSPNFIVFYIRAKDIDFFPIFR